MVGGELFEDLGLLEPVLHQLRRQLHEVCEDVGACEGAVLAVGKHAVVSVAHFVEQSCGIVEAQQSGAAAGEVVVVQDHGYLRDV